MTRQPLGVPERMPCFNDVLNRALASFQPISNTPATTLPPTSRHFVLDRDPQARSCAATREAATNRVIWRALAAGSVSWSGLLRVRLCMLREYSCAGIRRLRNSILVLWRFLSPRLDITGDDVRDVGKPTWTLGSNVGGGYLAYDVRGVADALGGTLSRALRGGRLHTVSNSMSSGWS